MNCDLSAHIKPGDARCLQYRGSASQSCRICDYRPNLAVVEDAMRGTCRECNKVDITLPAFGLCSTCYTAKRQAEGVTPPPSKRVTTPCKLVGKPTVKDAVRPPVADPVVSAIEVDLTDVAAEIDALWAKTRADWLDDISGATSIISRSRMIVAMYDSLLELRY